MARSYLSRIAQPLTSADPVVWSTPRAAADEARPSIQAATPALSSASTSTAAPRPQADTKGKTEETAVKATLSAAQARQTLSSMDAAGPPAPVLQETAGEPAAPTGGPWARTTPNELSAEVVDIAAPARPPSAGKSPISLAASKAGNDQAIDRTEPSVADAAWASDVASPPSEVSPSAAPRQRPGVAREPERAPRLHIGAVEIRMTQPPPAPAPPPSPARIQAPGPAPASAPLSRPYASRFGLAQS